MAAETFEEHGLVDAQDVDNGQEVENVPESENALEAEEEEADVELEMEEEDVELEIEQEIGAETDHLQEADDLPETVGSPEKDVSEVDLNPSDEVPEVDLNPSDEVPVDHNHLKVPEEKRWPGWPGENVFRMLVPVQMVGGIIGRKGEFIKKVCEETKARIKILDGPPGTAERTVMVSAKEEPDLDIPPALDGLLRIHKRIVDVDSDPADAQPGKSKTASTRLLVAATQAGSLIGKQGATIKTIQDGSNCTIRVLSGEHLPVCALPDDSVVEILGDPTGLHKAVELIAKHLRKFLVDRSVVGVFETQMQMPTARPNQMPPPQSWRPPPQGFPVSAGPGSGYGAPPQYMPPPRQYDNYYPPPRQDDNYYAPPDVAMDKMPRGGPAYARDAALGGLQQHQSIISKITQNMQIPLLYADAVIGTSGANISYIRRASGATIAIQETRGAPNEMTVEINGTSSQVQAAQQLIQNVMADAAAAAAQNSGTGPPGQAYNSYQHGPVYASPPSNSGGHNSHGPPGDYNSVYGGNYGY